MQQAQDKVLRTIQAMYGGIRDDATIIVLDIMPSGTAFPQLSAAGGFTSRFPRKAGSGFSSHGSGLSQSSSSSKSSLGCFCFSR